MTIEIGHVDAIFQYPVKSMAGERLEVANMGWHGIDGDRRLEEIRAAPWGACPDDASARRHLRRGVRLRDYD